MPNSGPAVGAVPSEWWASVQDQLAEGEYAVIWQDRTVLADLPAAYQAPNRSHDLRTYFTAGGIRVVPRTIAQSAAPAWEWGLAFVGVGAAWQPLAAAGAPVNDRCVPPCVDGNRVEYDHGDVVEWYVNDKRGLEQGFTVLRKPSALSNKHSGLSDECSADHGRDLEGAEPSRGPPAGRLSNDPLRLILALTGNARARVSADGQSVDLLAPGGARVIQLGELHALDATGRPLPAWFEETPSTLSQAASLESQAMAIVVDDTNALYPITIDPLATSPSWQAEGNQDAANFGFSVASAGDVNGDGYSDVIVGADQYDNGHANEGRAYVFLGSATGLSTTANWTAEGDQVIAAFGYSVATAGDVNNDGYSDVIVGARLYSNGQTGEGRALVWYGSSSGLGPNGTPANADWSAESNRADAHFGASVATAGDVNQDGYDDIVVGAPEYNNGQLFEGAAFVFHGSAAGLNASANWMTEGNQSNTAFGYSVATAGDVNGDGYSDVIVGAITAGKASVYHGSASGLSASVNWTATGIGSANFGCSVASAGNVNGDAYSDVIVGEDHYTNGQWAEGRAYVWHGSATGLGPNGTPANADWKIESDETGAWLGYCVASVGDVNGDGFGDVTIGSLLTGASYQGRAQVHQGSAGGLSSTPSWMVEGDQGNVTFGQSLASAGDVNGDGYGDVIVGASSYDNGELNEGRAYVFHGSIAGPTTGTCCIPDGSCSVGTQAQCLTLAGNYLGDGTAALCQPGHTPCPPQGGGACCRDYGACQLVESPAFCQSPDVYLGDGVSCLPLACQFPPGLIACCLRDQACVDIDVQYCEALGGSPAPPGSTCANTSCPPYEACCLPNGSCLERTPYACINTLGGTPQGLLSICPQANCPPPGPIITINEIRIDQPSQSRNASIADQDEYFELAGPASASLNDYWYIVIGDGPRTLVGGQPRGGSGVIEAVINLAGRGIAVDGLFLAAEDAQMPLAGVSVDWVIGADGLNFENNDNVTHLLVKGFTGQPGQDLDYTDDGVLDVQPWASIEDCVAVVEKADPDHFGDKVYCANRVGPVVSGSRTFSPGHVYRDATRGGGFAIGQFAFDNKSYDTPGTTNTLATGACCNAGVCTANTTKLACESGGGTWAGADTTCSPNPCVGACCTSNGACLLLTETACKTNTSNTFRGAGTDCGLIDCNCGAQRSFGPALVINEVWAGNPGVDTSEFVEVTANACGAQATQLMGGTSIIMVDGDCPGGAFICLNYKRLTFRYDFGPFEGILTGGKFVIGHLGGGLRGTVDRELPVGSIENGSQTYAIVRTQDLAFCFDPANPTVAPPGCQGIIDSHRLTDASVAAITAHLIDAVATTDTDAGDFAYFGAPIVKSGVHQASYMQRKVDGEDTNSAADWDTQWGVELGGPGDVATPGGANATATGACCTPSGCTPAVLRSTCENTLGGVYQGNGTTCSPDPCVGACCVGSSCFSSLSPAACASAGGAFMGRGTPCATVNCEGISIAQAKALPRGSPVVLDQLVVTSKNDLISNANTRCFQVRRDADGATISGLNAVMDPILSQIGVGHTIRVAGTTGEFLGLFELTSDVAPFKLIATSATGAGEGVISLTAEDLQDGAAEAETSESRLVQIPCLSFIDGDTGFFKGDKTYLATDGTFLVDVFIPATAAGLVGMAIPSGAVDLRGILWQADHEDLPPATMNKGYRLTMRSPADFTGTASCGQEAVGACCAPVGTCSCGVTTAAICAASGGQYFGDGTDCSLAILCDSNRVRGDIENDGDVDLIDLQLFVLALLNAPEAPAHVARSDLNCSGGANGADIPLMADTLVP